MPVNPEWILTNTKKVIMKIFFNVPDTLSMAENVRKMRYIEKIMSASPAIF